MLCVYVCNANCTTHCLTLFVKTLFTCTYYYNLVSSTFTCLHSLTCINCTNIREIMKLFAATLLSAKDLPKIHIIRVLTENANELKNNLVAAFSKSHDDRNIHTSN
jgi:hypothetical protein